MNLSFIYCQISIFTMSEIILLYVLNNFFPCKFPAFFLKRCESSVYFSLSESKPLGFPPPTSIRLYYRRWVGESGPAERIGSEHLEPIFQQRKRGTAKLLFIFWVRYKSSSCVDLWPWSTLSTSSSGEEWRLHKAFSASIRGGSGSVWK